MAYFDQNPKVHEAGRHYYNIRESTLQEIPELRGKPVPEYTLRPIRESVVAVVEALQGGRVKGWVCRNRNGNSVSIQVAVDGVITSQEALHDTMTTKSERILEMCYQLDESRRSDVLPFNISLPLVVQGEHELRVLVDDGKNVWEAHNSPLKYEETTVSFSQDQLIKRKDDIIVERNREVAKLWDEIQTQVPWKRAELDAASQLPDKGSADSALLATILIKSVRIYL